MTPSEVAIELQRRKCRLYHSINLPDFRTYAAEEALVSRKLLLSKGIGTPFASDKSDEERGLLDRCFGNLSDFGRLFWERDESPPNVYGPILLVFKPEVFAQTSDAAVTLKNAAAPDFDLATDRISTPVGVRNLFVDADGSKLVQWCFFAEFSTATNRLSFEFLDEVVVEPLSFYTTELQEEVSAIARGRWTVTPRSTAPLTEKAKLLDALAEWSAMRGGTPPRPMDDPPLGVGTWWRRAKPYGVAFRWFQYIVSTLKELGPEEVEDPAREPPRCCICEGFARTQCSGCGRWLCYGDFFGIDEDGRYDANAQGRCWECCYDPT